MADPIAPPNSFQSDPVAHVDVTGVPPQQDQAPQQEQSFVPKEISDAAATLSGKGTPDQNVATGKAIEKAAKDAPYLHMNEQMQLPGMIFSALKGDLAGVWKYYNGGPVQYETARGADGKFYQKGYNANGFNGQLKSIDDNHELSQDEINALNAKGGTLSGRDAAILKGANYDNMNVIQKAVRDGSLSQSQAAFANSLATAKSSTASHNLAQQIINETESISPKALNALAGLDPKVRAEVLRQVNAFQTANKSQGQTSGQNTSANTANNQANSQSANGGISGNIPGSVAPAAGSGIGASVGTGVNNTAQTSFGTNASQQAGTTQSQQSGNQIQSTIASNVNALTAGAMNANDFQHFVRLQELNEQLKQLNAKVPPESYAPGYVPAADVDVSMAGRDNILKAMVQHQKNASLNAAFADKVNRDWQEMGRTGVVKDGATMAQEFANSDLAKGIENSYNEKAIQDVGGLNRLPPEQRAKLVRPHKAGQPYVEIGTNKLIKE